MKRARLIIAAALSVSAVAGIAAYAAHRGPQFTTLQEHAIAKCIGSSLGVSFHAKQEGR